MNEHFQLVVNNLKWNDLWKQVPHTETIPSMEALSIACAAWRLNKFRHMIPNTMASRTLVTSLSVRVSDLDHRLTNRNEMMRIWSSDVDLVTDEDRELANEIKKYYANLIVLILSKTATKNQKIIAKLITKDNCLIKDFGHMSTLPARYKLSLLNDEIDTCYADIRSQCSYVGKEGKVFIGEIKILNPYVWPVIAIKDKSILRLELLNPSDDQFYQAIKQFQNKIIRVNSLVKKHNYNDENNIRETYIVINHFT